MWRDNNEPVFVQPLSLGLNQDCHIRTAEEGQSLWAELGEPKVIEIPQTPDLSNIFQEGGPRLDVKTLLNQFCQRVCRRPVTKKDILYTTIWDGPAQISATVKLNCVGGEEFRGDVCSTRRAAHKSAAHKALQAHIGRADERPSLPVELGDPKVIGSPHTSDMNNMVGDELLFREGGPPVDLKTLLNQFCQRVCRRPVTKEDILYTTIWNGHTQFTTTVKLNCIGGGEFKGDACSTRHAAERSAAHKALQAHKTVLSMLCWTNKPKAGQQEHHENNESHSSSSSHSDSNPSDSKDICLNLDKEFAYEPPAVNPTMTGKSVLNTTCMKILRRAMRKGDIVYERSMQATLPVPRYCCAVKLPCLPGLWGSKVWFGKVCSSQKAAEQSAAVVAVESILEDTELGLLASSASKQKYPKSWGQETWGQENNKNVVRPGNLHILQANRFADHAQCTSHTNIFHDGFYEPSQMQSEFVITV